MYFKPNTTKIFFWLFLFSSLFTACRLVITQNEAGEYRPKSEKYFSYKKANTRVSDTLLVDTNVIYIIQLGKLYAFDSNDNLIDSINNGWQYMRFYATGQVYLSAIYDTFPTIDQINNPHNGNVGYYKFDKKKRRIKIQYLHPYFIGPRTSFGKFDEGDILIYTHDPVKTWNIVPYNSKTERWEKTRIAGLKYVTPDW